MSVLKSAMFYGAVIHDRRGLFCHKKFLKAFVPNLFLKFFVTLFFWKTFVTLLEVENFETST